MHAYRSETRSSSARPWTRRRALRTGAAGLAGAGTAWLAACRSSDETPQAQVTTAPGQTGQAAATTAAAPQPKPGGAMTMAETANLAPFDPYINPTRAAQTLAAHAYSRLVKIKTGPKPDDFFQYNLTGDLGESWEIPSDGTQVTFKLRPGAKFHNRPPVGGRAATSEDIKVSLERFRSAQANPNKGIFGTAQDPLVTSVETPDPNTVVFKLASPYAPFLAILAEGQYLWVMPKEADSGFDPKKEQIGTGPYMLDTVEPDVAVKWKKHPEYFLKDQPYIDGMNRVFVADLAQQNAQFQAGRLDYHVVRIDTKKELERSNPKAQIIEYLAAGVGTLIGMQQNGNSPFRDVRVRRALSLAFDRKSWGEIYYLGAQATPANALPPTMPKYYLDPTKPEAGPGSQWTKYDPKAARDLLKAAGVENQQIRYLFSVNGYANYYNSSAEATAGMFKEAGFNLQIIPQDYLREWIEPTRGTWQGHYEGIAYGIAAPYSEPHFFLATHYHSKGSRYLPGVPDPRMDDMVEKQARTVSEPERIKLIHEFQRYQLEQMYYVHTGAGPEFLFLQPWVKGYNYSFPGWGSHIAESVVYAWIDKS